jgi:hypothetical protein
MGCREARHFAVREKQILRLRRQLDATGVHKEDLTAIRKRRDYHPNTRETGVCWGPRCWVGDDERWRRSLDALF